MPGSIAYPEFRGLGDVDWSLFSEGDFVQVQGGRPVGGTPAFSALSDVDWDAFADGDYVRLVGGQLVGSTLEGATEQWVTDNFAAINHNHDGLYAPLVHDHDDRYYTEAEADALLAAKASLTGAAFTGPVATGAGTAALPPWTFSGDPNTGIYNVSSDVLGFTTGGTKRADLSSSGFITNDVPVQVCRASAASVALDTKLVGGASSFFQLEAGGKQKWGPGGGAAFDLSCERATTTLGYASLRFDGSVLVKTANQSRIPLTVQGTTLQDVALQQWLTSAGTRVQGIGPSGAFLDAVELPGDPTIALHAATKQYVDAGDAGTLAAAYAYTDAGDVATLSSAQAYTDAAFSTVDYPVDSVFGRTGDVVLLDTDVTGALGYTPANRAGDTFTGSLLFGTDDTYDVGAFGGRVRYLYAERAALGTHTTTPARPLHVRFSGNNGPLIENTGNNSYSAITFANPEVGAGLATLYFQGSAQAYLSNQNTLVLATFGSYPIRFVTDSGNRLKIDTTGQITPGADNTQDLGDASFHFRTGYFGTSVSVGTTAPVSWVKGGTNIMETSNALRASGGFSSPTWVDFGFTQTYNVLKKRSLFSDVGTATSGSLDQFALMIQPSATPLANYSPFGVWLGSVTEPWATVVRVGNTVGELRMGGATGSAVLPQGSARISLYGASSSYAGGLLMLTQAENSPSTTAAHFKAQGASSTENTALLLESTGSLGVNTALQVIGHVRPANSNGNLWDIGTSALPFRTGYFGTSVIVNTASGYAGRYLDLQAAGTSRFYVQNDETRHASTTNSTYVSLVTGDTTLQYGMVTFSGKANAHVGGDFQRLRLYGANNILLITGTGHLQFYPVTQKIELSGQVNLTWDGNGVYWDKGLTVAQPFRGPVGSASAPTYAITGETNTGLYRPAANQLGFTIAGTLRHQFEAANYCLFNDAAHLKLGSASDVGFTRVAAAYLRATDGSTGASRLVQGAPNSAPTDGNLVSGSMTPWLNETTGFLTFRVKNSSGTLLNAKVPTGNSNVTLVDAATIATDASVGGDTLRCDVSIAVDRTLGAPTNASHRKAITWLVKNTDVSSHTLTLTTGAGGFVVADDLTVPAIPAGKTLILSAVYDSTADRWWVTGGVTVG